MSEEEEATEDPGGRSERGQQEGIMEHNSVRY